MSLVSKAQILGKHEDVKSATRKTIFFQGCVYNPLSNSHPDQVVRGETIGLSCWCSCGCQDRHCSLCWCVYLALLVACVCLWKNMFSLDTGCTWGQGITAVSLWCNWGERAPLVLRAHTDSAVVGQEADAPGSQHPLSIPHLIFTKLLRHVIL